MLSAKYDPLYLHCDYPYQLVNLSNSKGTYPSTSSPLATNMPLVCCATYHRTFKGHHTLRVLNKCKLIHMPDEDVAKGLTGHKNDTNEVPDQLNSKDSKSRKEVRFPEYSEKACMHTLTRQVALLQGQLARLTSAMQAVASARQAPTCSKDPQPSTVVRVSYKEPVEYVLIMLALSFQTYLTQ